MKAAVVRSFDAPPRYEDFDLPPASDPDEIVLDVLAAGLHPRVRSGAAGRHYADAQVLPMIPGVDAVGRLPDGKLVYCVVHDKPFGTMSERVVADRRRCVPLPEGCDALPWRTRSAEPQASRTSCSIISGAARRRRQ